MALTNASRLADFGTGIGTQGAILQVDNADQMVGIGTTDPTSKLEVKGDFKVSAASTLSGAVKISDSTNSTSTTTGALIVTGGVGIGASLHVDGDVSIGGTLTYEDVTNIDSVGLLTARSGLRVTAGGVVVTAGVSTFTDDVKVNSTLTATEGLNVTAGVTTIAGDLLIADQIIHSGDSNTSIRFPAADQVKITTAGGSRLHITDNGKIGVGGDPTGYPGKFMVIGAAGGASGILCDREIISRVASGIANTERGFQQIIDGVEKLACFADNSGNFNLNNNNGKNRITVTEAGKVGLGTVNPQLNLHVHAESSNASFAHFTNTTTGVSGSDGVSIGLDSDENVAIYNYESSAIRFATGGSEKARIDSSGRLLVGTTAYKTNLNSSADAGGQLAQFVGAANDTSKCVGIFAYSGTSNPTARGAKLQLHRARSTDGTTNTAVVSGDLIGTVEFKGNDATSFTAAAKIDCFVDGTPGTDDMPGRLVFSTSADGSGGPTERLRISNSGYIQMKNSAGSTFALLRNAASTSTADMLGSIDFGTIDWDSSTAAVRAYQDGTDKGSGSLRFYTQATAGGGIAEYLRIASNGNIYTNGNTSLPTGSTAGFGFSQDQFYISYTGTGANYIQRFYNANGLIGSVLANGSGVAYNTSSDYRLKENEVAISDGIERLKTLKPYRFNFKKDPSTTVDGFFSHEVTAVPEAISGEKDGTEMQGVDYGRITPLLTAALQEAIAEIETLKAKVAALESN